MRRDRREEYRLPSPPKMGPASPQEIGRRGERNLKRVSGGVMTPGSGSGRTKGDVLHGFTRMIEKKSTAGKSIRVRREDLEKLVTQAFEAGREPVFALEFESIRLASPQWGMVPLDRLFELFEAEERLGEMRKQ